MSQLCPITHTNFDHTFNISGYLSIGDDSEQIQESWKKAETHFDLPMSRFMELYSSVRDKAMHHAYQEIIGMGKVAIPMIMADLIVSNHHWFWALKAITGKDPVPPSKRGKIKEMAAEWILWWLEFEEDY